MSRPPLRPVLHRVLNKLEQRLGRDRLRSRPAVVDVVLTKACNLACTFCRDYEHPGARRVSTEQLERIAAELFPTARRVNVCSGGEPYLHTGLEHLLRLARRHGARTWVLSNGMLLEEARTAAILEEGLVTEHGFSVDGVRPETVEGIRTGARLPTILANIDMLLRLRERVGGGAPRVVIRYALMRRNLDELPDAVRLWGERGVERLECGYLNLANGIDRDESLWFHQERMLEVFARAREVATDFPGLELELPAGVEEQRRLLERPADCRAPWEFVMIDTSGRVLPCYRAFEALHMGALHGEDARPFAEIWNGPGYRALRRTVNDDAAPKAYAYCAVCEKRRGWAQVESHLGDETWKATAFDDPERGAAVDHRRRGYRTLEDWDRGAATGGDAHADVRADAPRVADARPDREARG